MTSSYTTRAADLPFPLKFLESYYTNKSLTASSEDVEKISYFVSRFALAHLLGHLDTADRPLPL